MDNIVYATFREGKGDVVYTKKVFQYDRGLKLRISGIPLPEKYQVHFSNSEHKGVAAAFWGSGSDVPIPDAFLQTGEYVYVWISFADEKKTYRSSQYTVIIPVEKRPGVLPMTVEGGAIGADLDQETHTLIFHY